jgi:hypothetical protein
MMRARSHVDRCGIVVAGLRFEAGSKLRLVVSNVPEFARRLYRLRLEKGWRAGELASRWPAARCCYVYSLGERLPDAESVDKLALALGVDPDVLLSEDPVAF